MHSHFVHVGGAKEPVGHKVWQVRDRSSSPAAIFPLPCTMRWEEATDRHGNWEEWEMYGLEFYARKRLRSRGRKSGGGGRLASRPANWPRWINIQIFIYVLHFKMQKLKWTKTYSRLVSELFFPPKQLQIFVTKLMESKEVMIIIYCQTKLKNFSLNFKTEST